MNTFAVSIYKAITPRYLSSSKQGDDAPKITAAQVIHRMRRLQTLPARFTFPSMTTNNPKDKSLTIEEFSRRGGLARARKYSKKQLREWSKLGGKLGGRPRKAK